MDTDIIDFSLPIWLINYYHIVGFFSIFINALGLYLVVYECAKMDSFRYYLQSFQVLCTITDIHMTCLMRPITLYPILAGYTVGILPKFFDVSTGVSMMILMALVILQLENLVWCFEKKHQSIAQILRKHVIPKFFVVCFVVFSIATPIVTIVWFNTTRINKEQQWKFIRTNYPKYVEKFERLENFEIFKKSFSLIILMICVLLGGMAKIGIFLVFIFDIFRMMNTLKTTISVINFQKHNEALRSLMVQLATSMFCLGPPCVFLGAVFIEIPKAQLITELAIAWFTCHSSVNVISLLIFFPPYQRFLARTFKRKRKTDIQPPSSILNH